MASRKGRYPTGSPSQRYSLAATRHAWASRRDQSFDGNSSSAGTPGWKARPVSGGQIGLLARDAPHLERGGERRAVGVAGGTEGARLWTWRTSSGSPRATSVPEPTFPST